MFLLGIVLTMGIGAALGSIGSGGSILALPVLVYVFKIPPADAVPLSLVLVGAASAGATLLRWRQGDVHGRALVLLASTGAAGAYVGSASTRSVTPSVLMEIFAAIVLLVGLLTLYGLLERLKARDCNVLRCLVSGALVGWLSGFLGVGGGFLLVPALIVFAGLDLRRALGTSVAIITINAMAGIAGQLRFMKVDWPLTGLLVAATLVGMGIGIVIANRLREDTLRRALAFVMIGVGLSIVAAQWVS